LIFFLIYALSDKSKKFNTQPIKYVVVDIGVHTITELNAYVVVKYYQWNKFVGNLIIIFLSILTD